MNSVKLKEFEKRVSALHAGMQSVTVHFKDGTQRTMRIADAIQLMRDNTVVDVTGDPGTGNGVLLELLRGLLVEVDAETRIKD